MHQPTLEVYAERADEYAAAGRPGTGRAETWAATVRPGGRILDLGCGPGRHLPHLIRGTTGSPVVGLDAVAPLLAHARTASPDVALEVALVLGDLARLPFVRHAFAGVWASRAHQHLPAVELPLALAELHRVVEPGGTLNLTMFTRTGVEADPHGVREEVSDEASGDDLPGRLFTWWDPERLVEVVEHAAFAVTDLEVEPVDGSGIAPVNLRAEALVALPDHLGADMRLLFCGINPSEHSARAGVGYVSPSNRFWPALLRADITDVDRDPRHLLRTHRVGMTDLVQRPTPRAADLDRGEYRSSLARLDRLCRWLRPAALVVVTLGGWREASGDRRATAGWQPGDVGGTPVYVMPSTSGLNAHTDVEDLARHLERALAGP